MKFLLLFWIRFYQLFLSPAFHLVTGPGSGCRFEPSCSEYSKNAIFVYGAAKGARLSLSRLLRCHPFSK